MTFAADYQDRDTSHTTQRRQRLGLFNAIPYGVAWVDLMRSLGYKPDGSA
ncbi:hypothetical protein [Pseudomonas fluorescens]|nr:hypothetical protein [Pseudomonas fluorescens]